MSHGTGATLIDVDGHCYIDFDAGDAVALLGHAHPQLIAALEAQLHTLTLDSYMLTQDSRLSELIACLTPGELTQTQLYSNPAEALQAALALARKYTQKHEIIGFWGNWQDTTGSVGACHDQTSEPRRGEAAGGTHLVPYADCYRCPFQARYPDCGMFCLDFMRQHIKQATAGNLAAIIVEPIHSSAGNVVPPPEFLPGVQAIAHEADALLIVDERVTGFGRTGAMFASTYTGVTPDMMLIGQGMGGGFPVSGVVSTPEIAMATYSVAAAVGAADCSGHLLAITAALTTIQTLVRDNLVQHTAEVGALLLDGLWALQEKYACIGDVRGQGLLLGMDLVSNRKTKEALPSQVAAWLLQAALQRGLLLTGDTPRLRLNPPLVITAEQIRAGVDILDAVFHSAGSEVRADAMAFATL
jgi:4-aminobutyrate aminotransferase-like enzyme